ncbi:MAG TPA: sugar-transfer associated ATP-grasp domain-containing protein [Miltoncostaeaceae bacterium]|nr:sugar-transfer associated ATP-grasp domain-containing protein [Miltoncostaeaceae bacterium]
MSIAIDPRVARVARRLNAAAARYDAPVGRVALRALRLRAHGWRLGDMAAAGLLDPHVKPGHKPWAVVPRQLERLQEAINPPEYVPLCEDKRLFADACRRFGLPTPVLAATLERSPDPGGTARDWAALLAERAPAEFVVKPVDGHRGIGVRVMARGEEGVVDHRGGPVSWAAFGAELAGDPHPAYIVQERLHPHPDLVRLTGSPALQTIRAMTLVEPDGEARVMSWGIRLAIGDQPIDSFHGGTTGNLWALMNDDGSLATPTRIGPGGFDFVYVPRHPTTGVPIAGVVAPRWEEARELALRAARAFSALPAVGWDIAVTPDAIVLTEGNAWWSLLDPDGPIHEVAAALTASIVARNESPPRALWRWP